MSGQETGGASLPYISWATCLHQIERMEKNGVPRRVDSSYLVGMSGGTQAQMKHALRALDLIDDDGVTKPRLVALAQHPDQRPQGVGDLLRERFPQLTEIGLDATRGDLDEKIRSTGLTGTTARKAATFYLSAATYANLPLSPHIKPARSSEGGGATATSRTAPRKRARRKPAEMPPENHTPASTPPGYSTQITIGHGTKLTLVVENPDPFGLSPSDRDFIFELIDKMKARAEGPKVSGNESKEADSS